MKVISDIGYNIGCKPVMNEWMKILVLGKTFRCTRNTFRAYLIKLETVSDKHLPLLKYDTFYKKYL